MTIKNISRHWKCPLEDKIPHPPLRATILRRQQFHLPITVWHSTLTLRNVNEQPFGFFLGQEFRRGLAEWFFCSMWHRPLTLAQLPSVNSRTGRCTSTSLTHLVSPGSLCPCDVSAFAHANQAALQHRGPILQESRRFQPSWWLGMDLSQCHFLHSAWTQASHKCTFTGRLTDLMHFQCGRHWQKPSTANLADIKSTLITGMVIPYL